MKTITLDEVAYQRLKSWKRSHRDSFSEVVKRVVPEAGTLDSLISFARRHDTAGLPGNDAMEKAVADKPTGQRDPWTS